MNVTFFNGQSSKPIPAYIENKLGRFHISYTDENLNVISQSFPMEEWKRIDYNSHENLFSIENNDFPPCKIIFNNPNAIEYIKKVSPELINNDIHQKVLNYNIGKVIIGAFTSIFTILFLYIYVVSPFIGSQVTKMITIDTEIALGKHFSGTLINTLDIDKDLSKKLMQFYHSAGFTSNYPIEIIYVDENTVNAFAIPGGKIIIFKGLINQMDSYEELAGLIGHELAHVENRHSLQQISNKLSTYLLFSILTNDTGGITTALMEHTINFRSLKNSRSYEKEADLWSINMLKNLKINQNGMVRLLQKIKSNEAIENETLTNTLEYMSSHPLTQKRISYLKEAVTDSTHYQNISLENIFKTLQN